MVAISKTLTIAASSTALAAVTSQLAVPPTAHPLPLPPSFLVPTTGSSCAPLQLAAQARDSDWDLVEAVKQTPIYEILVI